MVPEQPQPAPPTPYPYPYAAYAYPTVPAPPDKAHQVPEGRHVPLIWTVTLGALAVVASVAALLGGLLRPLAPAPYSNTVYASALTRDDGAWQLSAEENNHCTFANGSLDATADETSRNSTPSCVLRNHTVGDFHLSMRLLPPADANHEFYAAIFVRTSATDGVAFLINSGGTINVYVPDNYGAVLSLAADQWHANAPNGNTLVMLAQGSHYTLAINDYEVYNGDLAGFAEHEATSGSLELGAVPPVSGSTEARFADLALTAP
jgi:hypothetical protein